MSNLNICISFSLVVFDKDRGIFNADDCLLKFKLKFPFRYEQYYIGEIPKGYNNNGKSCNITLRSSYFYEKLNLKTVDFPFENLLCYRVSLGEHENDLLYVSEPTNGVLQVQDDTESKFTHRWLFAGEDRAGLRIPTSFLGKRLKIELFCIEEIEDEESVKIDETFESENLESEHFSQAENKMYEMFTSAHSNRRFRPVSLESKCESIVSGGTTGTCYIEWPFIGKGQYQIDGFPEECKLELMNNTINEEAMPADFRRADKIISTLKGDYEKNAEIFQAKFVEFCDKKGETIRIE